MTMSVRSLLVWVRLALGGHDPLVDGRPATRTR